MFSSVFDVSNSSFVAEAKITLQSKMAAFSFNTDLSPSWKKGAIINNVLNLVSRLINL